MKTSTKVIIGIIAAVGLIGYFGYVKAMKLKAIFEKIEIKLAGIRSVKLSITDIRFTTDIRMINPTAEDFNVNGYIVVLKRFNFFYKGKYIATTKVSLSQIDIPSQNELVIKDIEVVMPTSTVLANLSDLTSFDTAYLTTEAVIEVAGNEIYIKE